jgi:prolipoprotein diacylglyceryl transferase
VLLPKFTWDIDPLLIHYPDWLSFMPGDGIRYYSLLYVGVFLGGYKLLDWQIRSAGGTEEDASDFVIYGVIAVLVGPRVGHVFFYEWERFLQEPSFIFMIHKGGLASHGGTIGLLVAMWLFTKRKRQSFVEGCDRFAYSAALGSTLIRIGNWFNSEIVGRKTDQTWGVFFPRYDQDAIEPVYRHPSQLYETAIGLFVLGSLYFADKKLGEEKRPRGVLISLFFALYFTGRFLVEFVKEYQTLPTDSPVAPLTMGQLLSIIPAAAGYFGVYISLKKNVPAHWYTEDDEDDDESDEDDEDDDETDGDEPDSRRDADVDDEFAKKKA